MFDLHVAAISVAVSNNPNYCCFHRPVNTDTDRDGDRDRGHRQGQGQGHRQGQGMEAETWTGGQGTPLVADETFVRSLCSVL